MSTEIKVPTWSVPLGIAFVTLAVSWGVLQANTAFASEERERIAVIAEDAAKRPKPTDKRKQSRRPRYRL